MLYLGIYGADGRIGAILLDKVKQAADLSLTHAIVDAKSPNISKPTGFADIFYTAEALAAENSTPACNAIIDFSVPSATQQCLTFCVANNIPLVIGTTGHSTQQQKNLEKHAADIPILQASNMSAAVNAFFMLIEQATSLLGEEYDIEIVEKHHKHKLDAPSGTAIEMGRRAAQTRGHNLEDLAQHDRSSSTTPRQSGTIGMQSVRGGKIVGEHEIMFINDNEQVAISHHAYSRDIFAAGALRAARWLAQQKSPGLYSMADVLQSQQIDRRSQKDKS